MREGHGKDKIRNIQVPRPKNLNPVLGSQASLVQFCLPSSPTVPTLNLLLWEELLKIPFVRDKTTVQLTVFLQRRLMAENQTRCQLLEGNLGV